jgi:hypothetical protein
MSFVKATIVAMTFAVATLGAYSDQANAQAPLADQAVKRLVGKWISPKGRTISFTIRDGNPSFQDDVEPGIVLSGAYRQDDSGAGYVLRYARGAECRYNMTVIGTEGEEINLRLVSAFVPDGENRFRCMEGTMKRTSGN